MLLYSSSRPNALKFVIQHTRRIKIVGTLVAALLVILLNYETLNDGYYLQNRSVPFFERKLSSDPGTIVAVINTAQMGTGGLSYNYIKSMGCEDGLENDSYLTYNCANEGVVVRTNKFEGGKEAVKNHRQQYPDGKCLIVTAIRSPEPWLPALYVQRKHPPPFCENIPMTKKEMLLDYKQWLSAVPHIKNTFEDSLPELLTEFNGGSLVKQFEVMDRNNGYSLLGSTSPDSVFAGCELLFLRMNPDDRWPELIEMIDLGSESHQGQSRVTQCPKLAGHIKMLEEYELTKNEKMALYTNAGASVADWFDAYGYIKDNFGPYNTPGTVVAVINTPRVGTGGLTQNFERSFECGEPRDYHSSLSWDCPDNKLVVRTPEFREGAKAVKHHHEEHPDGKCLIVTAIRSPESWLPALYIQRKRICENTSMTKKEMLLDYKQWLSAAPHVKDNFASSLPELLKEFNGGSLVKQFEVMDQNNGYSILESTSPNSYFAGCELLFLRMEQDERWPGIIEMMVPGNGLYEGESHTFECPELAGHIIMLEEYELTKDEKMAIYTKGGASVREYFNAYGYI